MKKVKFYIVLMLLIFSINLSSATVSDEISKDITTGTQFTPTPMSYTLEDTDLDELPPVFINETTITVTYFDIETSTNQTFPNGVVDLIFVDFEYTQQVTGYFNAYGDYYDGYGDYSYSGSANDGERVAGTYTYRLTFGIETLSTFGSVLLDFTIYGSLYYNNSYNYYDVPYMYFERMTTGAMFEAPVYTLDYYGYNFVDYDGNLLIDAIEVQFYVNARKSFTLDMYVDLEFFDGYDWFYSYSSGEVDIKVGLQIISVQFDATMLFEESPYNSFDLYFSGNIDNYWDNFSLYNYTYWDSIAIAHPNYDKPVVYIENLTFTPGYNQDSTTTLDATGYDFLMVNVTVSSKISGNFEYYIEFYDQYTGTYLFSDNSYFEIVVGTFTFTYFVDASLLASLPSGNVSVYVQGDIYDQDGNYHDDWYNSYYAFNATDFNPTGYYVEPTTPVDPKPEPTDPIDTNVDTNTTDALNGTDSTQTTPDVPVLDLPAPSLYLSLLSIFTVVVILRKRRL